MVFPRFSLVCNYYSQPVFVCQHLWLTKCHSASCCALWYRCTSLGIYAHLSKVQTSERPPSKHFSLRVYTHLCYSTPCLRWNVPHVCSVLYAWMSAVYFVTSVYGTMAQPRCTGQPVHLRQRLTSASDRRMGGCSLGFAVGETLRQFVQ